MTAWGVLRDRDAGRYLAGVLVSGFGSSAMMLAAGIWVKSLTGSSSLAALVGVCLWTPTLAGPLLGTVVDRVRRRPLLVLVNAAMAALLPLLLVVRTADLVWILFAVLVLYGTAAVLCDAAEAAVVTATVPGELRGDFNGLRMTANEAMKLLAPLAGAGLYVRYGGGSVAVLDAVTFALAAAVFAMVRVREEPPAPATTGWREQTAEGIRYLRQHPLLRRLVAVGSIAMLLSALGSSAIYAVVDAGLHRSPAFVGVLYAGQGAGSVVGGVVAGALLRRMPERVFAATGMLLFALGAAVRATPWVSAALIGGAAIGVGLPWVLIAALTAVQRETPAALIGRVAATASTLVFAPTAVGGLVGAGLVAVVDHRLLLAAVGTAGVLAAAYCLFQVPAAEADEVTSAADRGGQFFTDA
ncbi:MFS transporter [Streptomyces sp. H39-C1]|uniref:MFS transporter n=1 Tax=Streptomyces sp. H39-C1 TaxID=3004355 RepID=UPI0022AE82B1|nr:MFS transporter [Streptomyces sp. H39-C1]MCZ4096615.1 MFS transporter [Streptomyces sp. H39-C1]